MMHWTNASSIAWRKRRSSSDNPSVGLLTIHRFSCGCENVVSRQCKCRRRDIAMMPDMGDGLVGGDAHQRSDLRRRALLRWQPHFRRGQPIDGMRDHTKAREGVALSILTAVIGHRNVKSMRPTTTRNRIMYRTSRQTIAITISRNTPTQIANG